MSLPRHRILAASARHGEAAVAGWCVEALRGQPLTDDLVELLGGPGTFAVLRSGDYWGRVWGARGLLYVWTSSAAPAVVAGLTDSAWRVREMCGKVVRLREIGEAADLLASLAQTDDVPRVRVAAIRALARVGEAEHAEIIHAYSDADPDLTEAALRELSRRLDRAV